MDFTEFMEDVAKAVEILGVVVLVVGLAYGFVRAGGGVLRKSSSIFVPLRTDIGRTILLGLEILVAADIIRTVAVEPTVENVSVLGLIVLIRTFLSFSLEIEIEGVLPWRRGKSQVSRSTDPA